MMTESNKTGSDLPEGLKNLHIYWKHRDERMRKELSEEEYIDILEKANKAFPTPPTTSSWESEPEKKE